MTLFRFLSCIGVILAGLSISLPSAAALKYEKIDSLLKISGKADNDDVASLAAALTPEIKTVVIMSVSGGAWSLGKQLGALIEKAEVTTVDHGYCGGYVCTMMFLSGKQRLFSAAGRPEVHYLEIPFIAYWPNYSCGGTPCTNIPDWLREHTKLSSRDLEIYHKSLFVTTTVTPPDHLVFFPANAQFSHGNTLHCAREVMDELKKDFLLADCLPVKETTALSKGIITSDEPFSHASLVIQPDSKAAEPSNYAKLEEVPNAKLGLSEECKALYSKRFLRADSPRAFVISSKGACYVRSAQAYRPIAQAMTSCKQAKVGDCQFYAINDQVVFKDWSSNAAGTPAATSSEQPD